MKASLYDVLRGRFDDGQWLDQVREEDRKIHSIISNLDRLFNTRKNSLAHMPEYGLPDIAEFYRDMPHSVIRLQKAIKDAVEKYEPRLKNVRVEHQNTEAYQMRLVFMMHAELTSGERVRFETTFSSNEVAQVKPLRRRI